MKLRPRLYEAYIRHPDFDYHKGLKEINDLLKLYFTIEKPFLLDQCAGIATKVVVKKDERKYTIEILCGGSIYINSWSRNKEGSEADIRVLEKMLSIAFDPEDNDILMDKFLDDVKKIFKK